MYHIIRLLFSFFKYIVKFQLNYAECGETIHIHQYYWFAFLADLIDLMKGPYNALSTQLFSQNIIVLGKKKTINWPKSLYAFV